MSAIPLLRLHSELGTTIALAGVRKQFGAVPVLEDISVTLPTGQFLAIVGRSGSGKSTLLRLLSGLETPSRGTIMFDGVPPRTDLARLMFQEPRLLPWASVLDNVKVGLPPGVPKLEGQARALEALSAVGLRERASEWPTVLSGGQKQRVALARALVSRPRLLLLDEPLGALDALTRIEMQDLIARAWLAQRFTAILVTHDVAEAVRLADRILLLKNGAISLDLSNPAPHPRPVTSAAMAELEERILADLLERAA